MGKIVTLSELSAQQIRDFFKANGRKAAKVGLKMYTHKQRQARGRLGGRPRSKRTLKILDALKSGPKSRLEISRLTKIDARAISDALNNLRAAGEVINSSQGSSKKNTGKWELKHDIGAKSKTKNKDRQPEPRRQMQSAAIAS